MAQLIYRNSLGKEACEISETERGYSFTLSALCEHSCQRSRDGMTECTMTFLAMDGPYNLYTLVDSMAREIRDYVDSQIERNPDA